MVDIRRAEYQAARYLRRVHHRRVAQVQRMVAVSAAVFLAAVALYMVVG